MNALRNGVPLKQVSPGDPVLDQLGVADVDQLDGVEPKVPAGASIPALGLSNKAMFMSNTALAGESALADASSTEDAKKRQSFATNGVVLPYEHTAGTGELPVETELLQNTLWPETQKLYS